MPGRFPLLEAYSLAVTQRAVLCQGRRQRSGLCLCQGPCADKETPEEDNNYKDRENSTATSRLRNH